MYVGLIRLRDLDAMYSDMGQRFLDHNIRGALPEDKAVSRALEGAFRRIVIDGQDAPAILPFNHNGISLKAERLELDDGHLTVIEPRLLNGAQTVAAYHRFLAKGEANPALRAKAGVVDQLRVLCKIVTGATREFVTTVTVNNNRQNPVAAWNLRANDEIQLQLADRFRDELQPGIYYERQQKAFDALTTEELEEQGIAPGKAVELLPLAKTFLVSDGRIGWLSSISRIFEDDKQYYEVFCPARLEADVRRILLCYKIGYRLSKLVGGIADEWPARYDYVRRSRNLVWALLCQGVLNDPKVSRYAEWYGNDLVMQADYTDCLVGIAKKRCRPVLSALAGSGSHKAELAEGNFKFLLTDTAFKECMGIAYDRWGWALSRLR